MDGVLCVRSNGKTDVDILFARTTIHQLSYTVRFLSRPRDDNFKLFEKVHERIDALLVNEVS